jgi:Domain of unknown function (DUF3291)
MSVWRSVDDLRAYVYGSAHTEVMRRRQRWFDKLEGAYLALWWVPASHVPSPPAFAFKQLFRPRV